MSGEQKELTYKVLNRTGDKMPLVGLGTWKAEKNVTKKVVEFALKNGYTHLDCACDYGNEDEVGEGIKAAMDSGIKREDIWVTSKLWNTYHAKKNVKAACEKTLKDLGLKYLDLYLIHFPIALKYVPIETRYPPEWAFDPKDGKHVAEEGVTYRETWEAMEELVKEGLVKNIGVCNYNVSLLMDLDQYAKIKPAVLQIEHHPLLQQPRLLEFAKSKNIAVTGFSSFGPASYVSIFDWAKSVTPILEEKIITDIAAKVKKNAGQVILRWNIQRGVIVIPKSCNEDRLKSNLELFDFSIDEEDMKKIATLEKGTRFNDPGAFSVFPIYD